MGPPKLSQHPAARRTLNQTLLQKIRLDHIFERIRSAGIEYGPSFDSVGSNTGPGEEAGAKGLAPTLYFNDPNKHLLEIRTYAKKFSRTTTELGNFL